MPQGNKPILEGIEATPATSVIFAAFIFLVFYFITEIYFLASEYYAATPPYGLMSLFVVVGVVFAAYLALKRLEPERKVGWIDALFFGFGIGLASYALQPRINIALDPGGIKSHTYVLSETYLWEPGEDGYPKLDLYLKKSKWWEQFKPGDRYEFNLRKGVLDIWLVDMSPIYEAQQKNTISAKECSNV
jgi:hypothetical protein